MSPWCWSLTLLSSTCLLPTLYTNGVRPDRHWTRPRHENSPVHRVWGQVLCMAVQGGRSPVRPLNQEGQLGAAGPGDEPGRHQVLDARTTRGGDPLDQAAGGQLANAGAVGVDRGQRYLPELGQEGVVVAGDREPARQVNPCRSE